MTHLTFFKTYLCDQRYLKGLQHLRWHATFLHYKLFYIHSNFCNVIHFLVIITNAPSLISASSSYSSVLLHVPRGSVFVPLVGLVSQRVSEVLVGVEGSGQLIDVVVGADGPEVFNVVPEVRGGVGPVGNGWRLIIRYYKTRQTVSVFVTITIRKRKEPIH